MGTLKPGQVGLVKGKVGDIVVSKWKKKITTRSAPGKATKPASISQLDQRLKLSLISSFIAAVSAAIILGFQSCNRKMTPVNAAMKFHLNELIVGVYPDYSIDYTKVKLTLPNSVDRIADGLRVAIEIEQASVLKITWVKSEYPNRVTKITDQAYILCFNVNTGWCLYYKEVSTRGEEMARLVVPHILKGKEVHGYLFFVSANGKLVSNTNYLGTIVL